MAPMPLEIDVKIDARLFREFALFDTFRVKRRWKQPVLFAGIMVVFACICFSRHGVADQALFMGSVLLVVGLGLPLVYYGNFLGSVKNQIRKLGLESPHPVYRVTLADPPGGIRVVTRNGEELEHSWDSVSGVYRRKDCTYLYIQNSRAYLLPDKDVADRGEDLSRILRERVIGPK